MLFKIIILYSCDRIYNGLYYRKAYEKTYVMYIKMACIEDVKNKFLIRLSKAKDISLSEYYNLKV